MQVRYAALVTSSILLQSCGAGEAGNDDMRAAVEHYQQDTTDQLKGIQPCELLTIEEIAAQVDLSIEPSQRAAKHAKGVKHNIETAAQLTGIWPKCVVTWRSVTADGNQVGRGEFNILVMTADQLKMLEQLDRRATVEGVGDEAFYHENAPYARVGNVAVGIVEFPDTYGDQTQGAVELLRAAIGRLPRS